MKGAAKTVKDWWTKKSKVKHAIIKTDPKERRKNPFNARAAVDSIRDRKKRLDEIE